MWAYSDCGELELGFIPASDHGLPLPLSLVTTKGGGAYRKPRSPVKSQSALRPFGRANWLFRWETDQDGRGLTRHRGNPGRPEAATEGLEVEVGERVSSRHLVLSSSPVWLPGQDESGHWEERVSMV